MEDLTSVKAVTSIHESNLRKLGFQGPMGPSTLAPAASYVDTPKLIEIKGFKCIKPFNFII